MHWRRKQTQRTSLTSRGLPPPDPRLGGWAVGRMLSADAFGGVEGAEPLADAFWRGGRGETPCGCIWWG